MPDLSIPQHILDQIVAHARELAPFECCGLLAGTNKTVTHLYRITNIVAAEGAEKKVVRGYAGDIVANSIPNHDRYVQFATNLDDMWNKIAWLVDQGATAF